MKVRLLVGMLAFWMAAGAVQAWQPAGWLWWNGDYAYEHESGEWYWVSTSVPQWTYGLPPSNEWRLLQNSGLSSGWSWWAWPYAYDHETVAWYYVNENPYAPGVVNLRTGKWTRFGAVAGGQTTTSSSTSSTSTSTSSTSTTVLVTTQSTSTLNTTTTSTSSTTASGMLGALVWVGGEGNGFNAIPREWSFEEYSAGTVIVTTNGVGINGWAGSPWSLDDGAVVASLTPTTPPNGFPITGSHDRVAQVNGNIRADFDADLTGGATNVYIDCVVQSGRLSVQPEAPEDAQMAAYFNSNGHLVVRHSLYTNGFSIGPNQRVWTELSHAAVNSNDWVRLTITLDYYSAGPGFAEKEHFYTVALNGVLLENARAYTDVWVGNDDESFPRPATPGESNIWFMCADSGFADGVPNLQFFPGLRVLGVCRLDDVKITASTATSTTAPAAMVLIPGGRNQGVDPDFGDYDLAGGSFYMDRTEVSKAQWDEVYHWATNNGYGFDHDLDGEGPHGQGRAEDHPVQTVNWYDCLKWCNARSEKEGWTPSYYANPAHTMVYRTGHVGVSNDWVKWDRGYRLPTSAEWEYAARGGVASRRFPWSNSDTIQHTRANYHCFGESYDTSETRGYHPDYANGEYPYTSPIESFAPNGFGLYDMSGNVFEWCWDWYPGVEGTYRVLCGGSWGTYAAYCRVSTRLGGTPNYAASYIGFRAVLPAP